MFNITFLHPAYLWGVFGVAVPLAIHLWNKQEGRVVKIGSTELINEADSKQIKTVYFNEVLLLIIRTLMICMIVLLMADPLMPVFQSETSKVTYLFEEELLADKSIKNIADSLNENHEVRLFKKCFPQYDQQRSYKKNHVPDYWQLISNFNHIESDSLVIFTSARLKGLKGKRVGASPKKSHWMQINKGESIAKVAYAYAIDSLNTAYIAHSDTSSLSFRKIQWTNNPPDYLEVKNNNKLRLSSKHTWTNMKQMDPIHIKLVYDRKFHDDLMFIKSSLSVIKKEIPLNLSVEIIELPSYELDSITNILFWLSTDDYPENMNRKSIILRPDALASQLIDQGDRSNVYHITKRLNIQSVINYQLTESLIPLIVPFNLDNDEYDYRVLSINHWVPDRVISPEKDKLNPSSSRSITLWISIILVILFIVERSLSLTSKQ
ncbi:BatA domain-containing protein [Fulvivirga sediminis]|uniref:BatA domain-containing protein n=1 Tax=Fulvivirga sediminis TaxID=2803949 RepID=A0A937F8U1_9BACT|nr:BatA domain-containing protein [Fulvivirga sediminis]MBL3657316.1 BatA domain-containing protein [Fulvivirga sediminis]